MKALTPLSPLSRETDIGSIRQACSQHCWCLHRRADDDVAELCNPDTATDGSTTLDAGGNPRNPHGDESSTGESDSDGEAIDDEEYYVDPNAQTGAQCSALLFGHTTLNGCGPALQEMNDFLQIQNPSVMKEFAWPGQPPLYRFIPRIDLPKRFSTGKLGKALSFVQWCLRVHRFLHSTSAYVAE